MSALFKCSRHLCQLGLTPWGESAFQPVVHSIAEGHKFLVCFDFIVGFGTGHIVETETL